MSHTGQKTIVGVFDTHVSARQAVARLKQAGFSENQIGIVARHNRASNDTDDDKDGDTGDTYAGEGAATGVAAGAGIGALWGLGIVAGVLPILGPAIAGGALAAILTSAAAGAAVSGLAGTLVGMGLPKDEAEFYQSEIEAGQVLVTVADHGRETEAQMIMRKSGGYDMSARPGRHAEHQTIDVPVARDEVIADDDEIVIEENGNAKTRARRG